MMRSAILFFLGVFLLASCDSDENNSETPIEKNEKITITTEVLDASFEGNGVQWGGYDVLESWTGSPTLSEEDWTKLFERVSFMSPSLVRIMTAPGWNYMVDGEFDPSKSEDVLFPILDFCEENDINVLFGEWGHEGGTDIDQEWLTHSVDFLEYLIEEKNYTCIKYYNMVNEPNGEWSSIDGDYELWLNLMEQFHTKLTERGLDQHVGLIGPDVAVWDTNLTNWVSNTVSNFDPNMAAYDIHTYPSASEVRNGDYQGMIEAYKEATPEDKPMIMGEVGFKYPDDSELGIENTRRINEDPYASDDSNMFIYDSFYGIDMADVLIQNMLAGFSGVIIWGLDDAQYNIDGGGSTELKRWGFWNILGEEKFESAEDEEIRPWFYPMSLMCKYFPEESTILDVDLPQKKGLRAIAGEKNGESTIAIVNSHYGSYEFALDFEGKEQLSGVKEFRYVEGEGSSFQGETNEKGFPVPNQSDLDFSFGEDELKEIEIPARSVLIYTTMNVE